MPWKDFFSPMQHIETDELKKYIADHREGTYTLLDVRQPSEYEEARIAGGKLIPLPQLLDRMQDLDPAKPVFVY
jgi:rhodanese-related sulfurtransferase